MRASKSNLAQSAGRIGLIVSTLLGLSAELTAAQEVLKPQESVRPDRVRYVLSAPADPAHRYIHERLERRNVLERVSKFLSPFRLPRDVVILVQSCDGDVNAYYENATIVICYEYLAYIDAHAPSGWHEEGVRRRDAIIGPTVDLFLHEMGHAVFDLLKIPVLGREEDAADLFAAYIQLQADPEDALALISGVAFLGRQETREAMAATVELKHFAKEHGLPGQRLFNVLCVAYGFDPKLFADVITRWNLPPERAENCSLEYAQIDHAFKTLIVPHLDTALFEEVRSKKWLRFWPSR